MPSMSVRNRVAMFEHSAPKEEDANEQNENLKGPSVKHTSSIGKGNKWPLPTEENAIPTPVKQVSKPRKRISSPFLPDPNQLGPAILPTTPKTIPLASSPRFRYQQNKNTSNDTFSFNKTSGSPRKPSFNSKTSGSPRHSSFNKTSDSPRQSSLNKFTPSPRNSLNKNVFQKDVVESTMDSRDENNAPSKDSQQATRVSEPKTTLNEVQQEKKVVEGESTTVASSNSSTQSSVTNKELSSIANRAQKLSTEEEAKTPAPSNLTSLANLKGLPDASASAPKAHDSKSVGTETSASEMSRSSRAAKLSQASSNRAQASKVRGSRTVSKVSHQEARKALLQAAQRKKEKAEAAKKRALKAEELSRKSDNSGHERSSPAADRLASRAANVVAMKNSTKSGPQDSAAKLSSIGSEDTRRDLEIYTSGSGVSFQSDSSSKRRMNHPAFAARNSPAYQMQMERAFPAFASADKSTEKPPMNPGSSAATKPFSEELFSSFRHFKSSQATQPNDASSTQQETSKAHPGTQGRPPQPSPSPVAGRSPKTLREAMAEGTPSMSRTFDFPQPSPSNGGRSMGHISMDSAESPRIPEESLHSTSERNYDQNYLQGFFPTGQPKFAHPGQSFQNPEGSHMSSLSGSMISTKNEVKEQGNLLSEQPSMMTPSMRSGHSMAQSIVSVSPKAAASQLNNDFDYLVRSASRNSTSDADPSGLPPQNKEEPGMTESKSSAEVEKTTNEAASGTQEEQGVATSTEEKKQGNTDFEGFQPFDKSNSSEFKDAFPDQQFGQQPMAETFASPFPGTDGFPMSEGVFSAESDDVSLSTELQQGSVKADSVVAFGETKEDLENREVSISTKNTTSTSLRTGLSSVQQTPTNHVGSQIDISQPEGSTSIRTGLSGIQNDFDAEGSKSMRSQSVSMKSTLNFAEAPEKESDSAPSNKESKKLPVVEEQDEASSGLKSSKAGDRSSVKETSTLLGGSTATTDTSSDEDITGRTGQVEAADSDSQPGHRLLPPLLSPEMTRQNREEDAQDTSESSSSASKSSSRWKMKMPNVIKNVLAKASPRNTPRSQAEQNGKTGFSTSEDEDEDIFGGLETEDDLSKLVSDSGRQKSGTKKSGSKPIRKQGQGKFLSSGHTRKSEPPRLSENKLDTPRKSVRSVGHLEGKAMPQKKAGSPSNGSSTLFPSDRSGTLVESEVTRVESDITSSILGGNHNGAKRAITPKKQEENDKAKAKTPKAKTSKKTTNRSSEKESRQASSTTTDDKGTRDSLSDDAASMFMNLGCGLTDALERVANVCNFGSKDPEGKDSAEADEGVTYTSASDHSSSHLTDLEKRVWNEWDKHDNSKSNKDSKHSQRGKKKTEKVEHDRKREDAREKLLEIASVAMSSQMGSVKDGTGSVVAGSVAAASATIGSVTACTGTVGDTATFGPSRAASGSTDESDSVAESSQDSTGSATTESRSFMSGSDGSETAGTFGTKLTAPILLSFSQRSLIERFNKQLAHVGVEVLKLNRRNVWQVRYLSVSKEQVALVAHSEPNKETSGDVAQCPKALLWLKKFNAKNGGYSMENIDKNGHGGMLLSSLSNITVSSEKKDADIPIPKKLADNYKNSVLITLEYTSNGEDRSIEFRCRDNDEAQFLCTCMRVIRDLLNREQVLRLKTDAKKKLENSKV